MPAAGVRRAGARFLAAREVVSATRGGGNGGYFLGAAGAPAPSALFEDSAYVPAPAMDAPATAGREPPPAPAAPSAVASRITPAVLFVTVVLAVVLLVSGLLHVLRRLFLKTHHAGAGAGERGQLQHLFFPAHEDGGGSGGGLAQHAIDALPEFAYAELSGSGAAANANGTSSRKGKEKAAPARPFDCAVCLCEFAAHDRLRLLPPCGHAFHVACIDVWLRSSATCPLCRTKLSRTAAPALAPVQSVGTDAGEDRKQEDQVAPSAEPAAASSVVLPVRLGRFTSAAADDDEDAAESSAGAASSRIDARRCYSMGSYQYVLADEHLLVSVHLRHANAGDAATSAVAGVAVASGSGGHSQSDKKVFARGDSFSVSKIWQWRGSKRLPGPAAGLCADDGLPWAPAAKHDHSSANTRQQQTVDTS